MGGAAVREVGGSGAAAGEGGTGIGMGVVAEGGDHSHEVAVLTGVAPVARPPPTSGNRAPPSPKRLTVTRGTEAIGVG